MCTRTDAWVQYHEYYQKLHLDMQQTTDAAAQRRNRGGAKARVSSNVNPDCFAAVQRAIEIKDKPMVHIVDGSAVEQEEEGSMPRMTLDNSDLVRIREHLRHAARVDTPFELLHAPLSSAALDLGTELQGMAAEELTLTAAELQDVGLDLEQLEQQLMGGDKLDQQLAIGVVADLEAALQCDLPPTPPESAAVGSSSLAAAAPAVAAAPTAPAAPAAPDAPAP